MKSKKRGSTLFVVSWLPLGVLSINMQMDEQLKKKKVKIRLRKRTMNKTNPKNYHNKYQMTNLNTHFWQFISSCELVNIIINQPSVVEWASYVICGIWFFQLKRKRTLNIPTVINNRSEKKEVLDLWCWPTGSWNVFRCKNCTQKNRKHWFDFSDSLRFISLSHFYLSIVALIRFQWNEINLKI